MPEESSQIFREHSLEKISSPDQLDRLLRVVKPQSWLLVSAVGIGLALALVWSIFGRIPVTASGSAILVHPKQVVSFHAPSGGAIRSIEVELGARVRAGDLLATLHLPSLEKELEQERAKLEQFQDRTGELTELEVQLAQREREHLEGQRCLLEDRIETIATAAERYQRMNADYLDRQRTNLQSTLALSRELGQALERLHESARGMQEEGLTTDGRVVEAYSDVIANRVRLAELEVELQKLDLRANDAQEWFDEQMDLVADLTFQRSTIELREMEINRKLRRAELEDASDATEIERKIEQLLVHLENEGRIASKHTGEILEITVAIGQHVAIGEVIGKLEKEDESADLKALAYFRVKDGKKIQPGQKIRISPATVERERFGSILGVVVRVSPYPVTVDAAANQIGDQDLAASLLAGQSRIEVLASLQPDPDAFSKFRWTSGSGPEAILVTAGTTAEVRVTIEERAPLSLLLPFLRELGDG